VRTTTRTAVATLLWAVGGVLGLDYGYQTAEPQKTGWPLTDEERAYVLKPEYERRPGRENPAAPKHRPDLWPVLPSAGFWGGTSWLDCHAGLVKVAQANRGPIDVLLVGDSITMQWGAAWTKHFGQYKTVNIGIGGDKTQNVLWRLDHGGVDGLEPRMAVLLIGNNNMFFTPETGIAPAAKGIKVCLDWLRDRFPKAPVVVVKIVPAHSPGKPFYEDIKKTNAALDTLKLEDDPQVRVLDLWHDMVDAEGKLRAGLFTPDNIHLTQNGGYELYATRLKPFITAALSGQPLPRGPQTTVPTPVPPPAPVAATPPKPQPAITVAAKSVLTYPYAPYNDGQMDPQLTGWPLTDAERAWVLKEEYTRKPGHEARRHLPALWPCVPTAGHWKPRVGDGNLWLDHHATLVAQVAAAPAGLDIALLGDSLTQGWGGGWDGSPWSAAWRQAFGGYRSVNLGIAGDRVENLLWRLDHGALAAAPKVAVLMIGVNNAPLVAANGVPAEAVAAGLDLCLENLRARCPRTEVVLVKILPAFAPGSDVHRAVTAINAALDARHPTTTSRVHVLDLWREFAQADGSPKAEAYATDRLHLSPAGYERLAAGLKALVAKLLVR